MKKLKLSVTVFILCAAAITARGAEIKIDFDGVVKGVNPKTGSGHETLASVLAAAAAESGVVIPKLGDIPTPLPPVCVDSPYGCPGAGDGQGGTVPTPDMNAPFDIHNSFPAAVCVNTGDLSPECMYRNGGDAALLLGKVAYKKFIFGLVDGKLTFHFPMLMDRAKLARALMKLELEAVKTVENQVNADIQKLAPMSWMTPQERDRNLQMMAANEKAVNQWKRVAISEAMGGRNWEEINAMVYQYKGGPAYQQLGAALLGKEWFKNAILKLQVTDLTVE